jgi:hypothetical protein
MPVKALQINFNMAKGLSHAVFQILTNFYLRPHAGNF